MSAPLPVMQKSPQRAIAALLFAMSGALVYAQSSNPNPSAPSVAPSDNVVVLSVFEVNTDRDEGFVASTSLAGGRLAGDLVDTPVAYSVQTREFLDALNIMDVTEAINWTVNATTTPDDGGGQLFGGTGSSTIRGVSSNQGNRNFFSGGGNPSTYNMERMDYARGPNSVLFGTGSIGGTANVVLRSARLGMNTNRVRVDAESWGGFRGTVDINRKLGRDVAIRLVGTLQDTNTWRELEKTNRKGLSPSFTWRIAKNTRLSVISEFYKQERTAGMVSLLDAFAGWDGVKTYSGIQPVKSQTAFGASRIGSNTLVYSPASGVGDNVVMSYTGLMQTQGYSGQRPVNGVVPISTSQLGLSGAAVLDVPFTPEGLYDLAESGTYGRFSVPSRKFTNLGPDITSTDAFKDVTFYLDHQLNQDIALQLSGGKNSRKNFGLISYYTNNNYPRIYIDINEKLPNGSPNPNFLEPYGEVSRQERQKIDLDNEALRFAAAYVKDFRLVDIKANLMLGQEQQDQFRSREYYMLPFDSDPRAWGLTNTNRTRTIRYRVYWNQPRQKLPEFDQVTVVDPIAGTSVNYNPLWVLASNRADATILSTSKTRYYQASTNLSFLDKRLIVLGAYRADTVDRSQRQFLAAMDHPEAKALLRSDFNFRPDAPSDYWDLTYRAKSSNGVPYGAEIPAVNRPRTNGVAQAQYAGDRFRSDFNPPALKTTRDTFALGGIINLGRGFSIWSNYAQTFNPANLGSTTINFGTPQSSVSEGLDYGVRYSLGPKFYATLSRYESTEEGAGTSQPSGFSNIQAIINTNALDDPSSEGRNIRGLGDMPVAWIDQIDRVASGYELEVVANFTKNWRTTLNFGTSNASQTDAYRETRAFVDGNDALFKQILDDAGIEVGSDNIARAKTGVTTANSRDLDAARNAWNSLVASRANWLTGTQPLNRMTKYTANFFTDYRFTEGRFTGLRVGYGMQFRGKQVIGWRGADSIVDPANPARAINDPDVSAYDAVYQDPYYTATATLSYPVKLFDKRKVDLNLSITNLFDYDDPIYSSSGLRATDGNLASPARTTYGRNFWYVTPRSFRLSATYNF
jgi:outer membrane receptor protein involved in Fe transport